MHAFLAKLYTLDRRNGSPCIPSCDNLFQIDTKYSVLPVLYENIEAKTGMDLAKMSDLGNAVANTNVQGFISILALAANVICLAVIIKRSIEQKKNPYKEDIWTGTRDYEEAMARADR